MRKKDVVNLIRFHSEKDDLSFNRQAELIASEFYDDGDKELAYYVKSLISPITTIVPQADVSSSRVGFLERVDFSNEPLIIPQKLSLDLIGIVNASKKAIWSNKYLFYGEPGTGKTQASYQIARLLKRSLWQVNISQLIDSHLGETSKNIEKLFDDINNYPFKKNMVILFDEIDALAFKRDDSRDLREMSRATTELFNGLDNLSKDVVLIATTNLYKEMDKALLRRFVAKICFDVYERKDLIDVGIHYYNYFCDTMNFTFTFNKIVEKMLCKCDNIPNPGDLKNIILTSLAFSNSNNPSDHLKRLFVELFSEEYLKNISFLQETLGFTLREIELLTGISKSELSRRLNK